MKLPAMAGASPFAHLLGRARAAKKAEEGEEDPKTKRAASEESEERDERDEEEREDAKSAESEKDEGETDDGEEDEAARRAKKSKKAKGKKADAEDGDPDEGDEEPDADDTEAAERRGAIRMQKRCAAIFQSKHAAGNVALAAQLAFNTRVSADEAIGLMAAAAATGAPAPRTTGLRERMSAERPPVVSPEAAQGGTPDLASQILAAGQKRRGEV